MEDLQYSYYIVIPAYVRFADITPAAKLLYGEIASMCGADKKCTVANKKFAQLYDVTERQVQLWLKELVDFGFVKRTETVLYNGERVRHLTPIIKQKEIEVVEETKKTRRKRNISTRKVFVKPTVAQVEAYCLERQNEVDANRFVNFYESKGWLIGRNKMKDWKAAVRTWEGKATDKPIKEIPISDEFRWGGMTKEEFINIADMTGRTLEQVGWTKEVEGEYERWKLTKSS